MELGVKDKISLVLRNEQASKFNNRRWVSVTGKCKTGAVGTNYTSFSEAISFSKRKPYNWLHSYIIISTNLLYYIQSSILSSPKSLQILLKWKFEIFEFIIFLEDKVEIKIFLHQSALPTTNYIKRDPSIWFLSILSKKLRS